MRRAHKITAADMAGHVTGLVEATEGRQVQAGIVSEPVKATYV